VEEQFNADNGKMTKLKQRTDFLWQKLKTYVLNLKNDPEAIGLLFSTLIVVGYFLMMDLLDKVCLFHAVLNHSIMNPFIQGLWFYLLLAAPIPLLGRWAKFYATPLLVVTALISWTNVFLALVFSTEIGPDIMEVLFASSTTEVEEFTSRFFTFKVFFIILAMLVSAGIAIWQICKRTTAFRKVSILLAIALAAPFVINSVRLYAKEGKSGLDDVLRKNVISELFFSYSLYQVNNQDVVDMVDKPKLPEGLKRTEQGDILGVVVIGESASRTHMSLYGYPRPTTPNLEKLSNDMVVFDDVISSYAQTAISLKKSFTFYSNSSPDLDCSFIDLCEKEGFHTELISNQYRWGFHDNSTTLLFRNADRRIFLTEEFTRGSKDGNVIPELKKQMADIGNKPSVFFLHLIGNHLTYNRRYTPEYAKFDNCHDGITKALTDEDDVKMLNEYDNATCYNDYVISSIIEAVKQTKRPAYVLYFSDHSEPMFEDGKTCTRCGTSLTRYAYDVPFMVWLSPEYKKRHPEAWDKIKANRSKAYQTDDLIYALCGLTELSFNRFPHDKNIFSPEFKERQRIIVDQDYDKLYPRKDDFSQLFKKK